MTEGTTMANTAWNYLTLTASKEAARPLSDELAAAEHEWTQVLTTRLHEAGTAADPDRTPYKTAISYTEHGPEGTITLEFETRWAGDIAFITALGTSTLFTGVTYEVELEGEDEPTIHEWTNGELTTSP